MEPTTSKLEAWAKSICWVEMLVLVFRQGKTLLGPVKNKKTYFDYKYLNEYYPKTRGIEIEDV